MDSLVTKLHPNDQQYEPHPYTSSSAASASTDDDEGNDDEDSVAEEDHGIRAPAARHTLRIGPDLNSPADVLADGSLNYFTGVMQFYQSEGYAKYKTRKHREKCKVSGEDLWSSKAEDLFLQMVLIIPPVFGKTKIDCKKVNGVVQAMGRNQLIGYLMERHNPPVEYPRKKISSHTQVVKNLLAADRNAEALERIRNDPRVVSAARSKDFYFDEASMTLRAGEIQHSFNAMSALSRFVPGLQSLRLQTGTSLPMVQSVEFNMGVYQRSTSTKDSTAKLVHSCTTLQAPGGAAAKPLADIMPFINLYPSLQHILNHDQGCDVLWFEASIDVLEQMPTTTSHIGIEFKVDMLFAQDFTDWKFKTNFYHHSGIPSHEIIRNPNVEVLSDSKVNIEISLFSPWWVKLFQSRILKRQEAGARYRKQLQALQHGPCACKACVHLCAEIEHRVAAVDEHCRTYFQELSIMQSIYAKPQGTQEHRCVAVFLFKFSQNSGNQIPLTTWHRIIDPSSARPEVLSQPSNILPTQIDTLDGFEVPKWQPDPSDLVKGDTDFGWHDDKAQRPEAHQSLLAGNCSNVIETETLSEQAFPALMNGLLDPKPPTCSGLYTDTTRQYQDDTADIPGHHEIARSQESPSKRTKLTHQYSNEELNYSCFDDPVAPNNSVSLHFHELDLANFNILDFPYKTLGNAGQMMESTGSELLPCEFDQLSTTSFIKNDICVKERPDQIVLDGVTNVPDIEKLGPKSIDDAACLSLPPTTLRVPEHEEHDSLVWATSCSQLAAICQEEYFLGDDHNDGIQVVAHKQPSNKFNEITICSSTKASPRNGLRHLPLNYMVQQDMLSDQEGYSQRVEPVFQILHTVSSGLPQQVSPVSLIDGDVPNIEASTLDPTNQSLYVDDFDHFTCHAQPYHPPPTPPRSQDVPVDPSIPCQDNVSPQQQTSHLDVLDWNIPTDLDTHNWVLELAIAKTEDMIEEAYANYGNGQNFKAIQGVKDVEVMTALLEPIEHQGETIPQEIAVHPHGKILGEVGLKDEDGISLKPRVEYDQLFNLCKGEPRENTFESHDMLQEPKSSHHSNESNPQALFANDGSTVLDMEWLEQYQVTYGQSSNVETMDQETVEEALGKAYALMPATSFQGILLQDPYDVSGAVYPKTEYSTPEHEHHNIHYNSPQSVHSHHPHQLQLIPVQSAQDGADYIFSQHRTSHSEPPKIDEVALSPEQNTTVFTPQSIEVEMSNAGDDEDGDGHIETSDTDLTERVPMKIEEEPDRQSEDGSYHIVKSENHSSFPSPGQDSEWEKIEYEDLTPDNVTSGLADTTGLDKL